MALWQSAAQRARRSCLPVLAATPSSPQQRPPLGAGLNAAGTARSATQRRDAASWRDLLGHGRSCSTTRANDAQSTCDGPPRPLSRGRTTLTAPTAEMNVAACSGSAGGRPSAGRSLGARADRSLGCAERSRGHSSRDQSRRSRSAWRCDGVAPLAAAPSASDLESRVMARNMPPPARRDSSLQGAPACSSRCRSCSRACAAAASKMARHQTPRASGCAAPAWRAKSRWSRRRSTFECVGRTGPYCCKSSATSATSSSCRRNRRRRQTAPAAIIVTP
mmetsp:Transcript_20820/g.71581  ORF Transcript_20820/g.71581 Transcript_20820/m.71581 type:complete len:277 (-) Transcript_20820:531-1361(-)